MIAQKAQASRETLGDEAEAIGGPATAGLLKVGVVTVMLAGLQYKDCRATLGR